MASNQFVDALKLFLDTAEPGELESLAVRLKPYRITSLQVQKPEGTPNPKSIPVIVLDDGKKTPGPAPTLQQHLDSLAAASQDISMPVPALAPNLDSFFDATSLPWFPTDQSCLGAPGSIDLPFEDMMLDEDQFGDLSAEFSMPGTQDYYHTMQDPKIPISPPYTDFLEATTVPSTFPSDPYAPPSYLITPTATPAPPTDFVGYSQAPTQANSPIDLTADSPISSGAPSPRSTYSSARTQAKINRRRNNNSGRSRKGGHTAASITQAILSSSASTLSSSSNSQSPSPDPATAAMVFSNCIRKDYVDFLRTNLPDWVREGLWQSSSPLSKSSKTGKGNSNKPLFMTIGNTHAAQSQTSTYGFLENIYSCVSQLDSRIETDQVRKRVALVLLHSEYLESYQDWKATRSSGTPIGQNSVLPGNIKGGVGRGDMTLMIDNILEQTTPGWNELSPKRKLQLRALFHERKRYGKRWAVFREEVGCAILLVCSSQLGNMVSNTKVTMAALKGIAQGIKESPAIMEVLNVLEPLAEALVNNEGYKVFGDNNTNTRGRLGQTGGVGQLIQQFEELQAKAGLFDSGDSSSEDEEMD